MSGWRSQRRRRGAIRAVLLAAALGAFLLPLVWTSLASLGLQPDNNTRPPSWSGSLTLDQFGELGIAEPAFWQELSTSSTSAACAAALTVAASLLAAYGLARSRFPGDRLLTQGTWSSAEFSIGSPSTSPASIDSCGLSSNIRV